MSYLCDTPVILLHGLGPAFITGMSLHPLNTYLESSGFINTHIIKYNVNHQSFEESLDEVDAKDC